MTEQDKIRLAEWAGFTVATDKRCGWHYELTKRLPNWMQPDAKDWWEFVRKLPDFPHDLNACFRWLVPKLDSWTLAKHKDEQGFYDECKASVLLNGKSSPTTYAKDPAEALCQAVLKLVKKTSK